MSLPVEITLVEHDPDDPYWESDDFKEYCRQMDEALASMTDDEYLEQFGHPRKTEGA